MSSTTIATRTRGRRCAACNQRTETWVCDTCAFNSLYYRARFNDDMRPASPTNVGKRGLYPSPAIEYRGIPSLPALNGPERLAEIRHRVEAREDLTVTQRLTLLQDLKTETKAYDKLSRGVDANARRRELAPLMPPDHWNYVRPLDPRRWCDDCTGARVHRAGCPLIELDGRYVGGYPDDGTRVQAPKRFAQLTAPGAHWQPSHHRRHARAVARRWRVFCETWTRIGLDYWARVLEAGGKKLCPPQAPSASLPRKRRGKKRSRLSPSLLVPVPAADFDAAALEAFERRLSPPWVVEEKGIRR